MSNYHITPKVVFPATLIVGHNPNDLVNLLAKQLGHPTLTNNPDLLTLNESTGWTIDSVRQIRTFFSQKPFSHPTRLCLILNSENLENPAQNAILKILEEPGSNNYLIFTSQIPGKLLPTILSRCHVISLQSNITTNSATPIPTSIAKQLLLSDKLGADKVSIKPWLEAELSALQCLLVKKPNLKISANIKNLIKAIDMINHRVDPRAALDFYLLSFQSNNQ
jgi:DNA polymerase-3 subunit delta'